MKEKQARRQRLLKIFLNIAMAFSLLCGVSQTCGAEDFRMSVLDVGQGLCVLFESDGHAVLYDGGGREASAYVVGYLGQQDIVWLDYIIASHYDEDHIAGVVGAIYSVGCDLVLSPDYEGDTAIYQSYLQALSATQTPQEHPRPGDVYDFGEARIEILGPGALAEWANDNCIAAKVTCQDASVLVCGDAQYIEEGWLTASGQDLSADVYIVNHHGSDTSTTVSFLKEVSPSAAVISCGEGNAYGHPTRQTLNRLADAGCDLYRTDRQGGITARLKDGELVFTKEPTNDWSAGLPLGMEEGSGEVLLVQDAIFLCNANSLVFHRPNCPSAAKISERNRVYSYESREDLMEAGYRPCKNCRP